MTPEPGPLESELRRDPLSGRLVVIAPGRAKRPGAFRHWPLKVSRSERESCPFCAGHEERTPPELLRLPAGDDRWKVRVVPNLYPAFAGQEIVINAPRHCHFLAELADDELALVAETWQTRATAHEGYLHAFVNEHAEAGASLPHTHSQLVWFDGPPPEVERELEASSCCVCEPDGDELVVAEREGVVLRVAWAGRMPYELLVAPVEHEPDPWRSTQLAAALQLAAEGLRRLHELEGPCPMNLWLHESSHWHIEIVPRLTILAGIELGAGYFVNPLPPETAAAALRR
jgi:UDPglucose--hexose-1-phosphate uridylyltransferase